MPIENGTYVAAFVAFRILDTSDENVMNAAADDGLTGDAVRAPSPLNGERAGVRGEAVRMIHLRHALSSLSAANDSVAARPSHPAEAAARFVSALPASRVRSRDARRVPAIAARDSPSPFRAAGAPASSRNVWS